MPCYRRNSHAYRKRIQPAMPIPVMPKVPGDRHVAAARVSMTGETDGAAVPGHEVEMLAELLGEGAEIFNKARHVGPDVVTEKYALRSGILHNMEFGKGAEVLQVFRRVKRIEIVLLV